MHIDLHESLLVWHASPATARETIARDGVAIVNEAIYVGLHPGIPTGYAQHHRQDGFVVSLLALPHAEWRWGWDGDYELTLAEGYLRRAAEPETIAEIVTDAEAVRRQQPCPEDETPASRGASWWCWHGRFGYQAWLDEAALAAQCDALLEETAMPQWPVLGAAYLHFTSHACREARLPRMAAALRDALRSPLPLPDSAAELAVQVWQRANDGWAATLAESSLGDVPFRRIGQLWTWLCASGDRDACGQFREQAASWQRQLGALAALMAVAPNDYAAEVDLGPPDARLVEALVTVLTHGPMHNARAMAAIRAIERLPEHLGDAALLELLRRLRFLPSRARRNVSQALLPRASRLEGVLRCIAAQQHGSIRAAAEFVLKHG